MKKIISAVISLSILGLMIAPVILAQAISPPGEITKCKMRHTLTGFTGITCPPKDSDCEYATNTNCGACCVLDTIYTISDWVFYIVLAFAIIFISLGAFFIMTAGGEPDKVRKGRDYILYAVIGLIIGLMAKTVPYIAKAIIGA
jgi:hypothetical protein